MQSTIQSIAALSGLRADASYRVWSQFIANYYVLLRSKKHKIAGSMPTPLVCTVCGYVQFFVNPEDFRDQDIQ